MNIVLFGVFRSLIVMAVLFLCFLFFIFALIAGIDTIRHPCKWWYSSTKFFVVGGQPTKFSLLLMRIFGITLIIIAIIALALSIYFLLKFLIGAPSNMSTT